MNYIALLAMGGEVSGPSEAPGWNRALRWNTGKVRYEYIIEHY